MKNNRLILGLVVLLSVVTATLQLLPSSQQTTSVETLPPSTTATSTIPVTTTSVPAVPSTTVPKRQATTTVPTAPKTKTPVITGTPSEILDSGNFGLYGEIGPLQKKYAGAATLSYKSSSTEQYYTATSGALTQAWYVEMIDAELVLIER